MHADRIAAAITPRTKAILLSSPANPTGAVQAREDLAAMVELAVRHDLYLISDEIYERLSYLSPHVCVAALPGALERRGRSGPIEAAPAELEQSLKQAVPSTTPLRARLSERSIRHAGIGLRDNSPAQSRIVRRTASDR